MRFLDTRNRGLTMPQSMRRRQSNQHLQHALDSDSYRPDSGASAETFITSATGDYETPRSASASTRNSIVSYGFGAQVPRYSETGMMSNNGAYAG